MCTVRKSRVKKDAAEWGRSEKERKEGREKRGRRSEDNKF